MRRWTKVSEAVTGFTGSGKALISLLLLVGAWVLWGYLAEWPPIWRWAMWTGAPMLSLILLVFLQHAQNRDAEATHIKLNELLLTLEQPRNEVVAAETKPDDELRELAEEYTEAAVSTHDPRS